MCLAGVPDSLSGSNEFRMELAAYSQRELCSFSPVEIPISDFDLRLAVAGPLCVGLSDDFLHFRSRPHCSQRVVFMRGNTWCAGVGINGQSAWFAGHR